MRQRATVCGHLHVRIRLVRGATVVVPPDDRRAIQGGLEHERGMFDRQIVTVGVHAELVVSHELSEGISRRISSHEVNFGVDNRT